MKTAVLIFLSALVPVGACAFTVHEWGTFTTVSAPDGSVLPGLEREEENLPNFVHSHAGFAPGSKGWTRPLLNVTVKMETPVLYVYSPDAFRLRVAVDFIGGSISQWYPERVGGETLPLSAADSPAAPIDFARGFHGSAVWDVDILAAGVPPKLTHVDWETRQWPRARLSTANTVRGPGGEEEGFVFYRGVGNFGLHVRFTSTESGGIRVENTGAEPIAYLLAYQRSEDGDCMVREMTDLAPGETQAFLPLGRFKFESRFQSALQAAGLTENEAAAMLATWRESYFERPGLRVFWIVPRAFTDRVLPLRLDPPPEKLERVLVGRSEVITPTRADELARDFRTDGGARWKDDRYFIAYRELARRCGVLIARSE